MSNPIITEFIDRAHGVTVAEAVDRLGLKIKLGDKGQPCPQCGGKDRFSVNLAKQAWNCRNCSIGGRTGVGLIGFVLGLDLHRKAELLEACATALSEVLPDEAERETDEERAARLERMAKAKADRERANAEQQAKQDKFRDLEINRARGIYFGAIEGPHADDAILRQYLKLRTGADIPDDVFANLRFSVRQTYWREDEWRRPVSHYVGYAMIAPMVTPDARVVGCHITWIDLSRPPKYRPDLGLDADGDPLPTKKMRGPKKGTVIPVCGDLSARRWVISEGIENVVAIAGREGWRTDTFYGTAGDIHNLAGPADPSSAFNHPTSKKEDKRHRLRAVRVAGPVPLAGQGPDAAYQVPDHVDHLVHLADGDSEPVFTASAMARAETRCSREGRVIETWWPLVGMDFAGAIAGQHADAELGA